MNQRLTEILEGLRSGAVDPQQALERYQAPDTKQTSRIETATPSVTDNAIAIVGVAGRYPGSNNVDEFWQTLMDGRDCVTEVPAERWDHSKYYSPDPRAVGRTVSRWGGFLSGVDQFDPAFFNISPKEAELMDPQQRLFLQEAWTALEEAGYASADLDRMKCGVFVGCGPGDYYKLLEDGHIDAHAYSFMGNAPSILAARIAYHLNLRGAAIAVDTACSSSLVAIHLACESIRNGDCVMALAGGVSIFVTPQFHILSGQAGMLSPDGRCRAFDDGANGFVPAEGVGAVVLKNYSRALEDGDHIHAIIRGSGINQDGRTTGITAPSAPSQADLERDVYNKYNIDPESISYIECHGTGTKLGDPIEIQGLTESFKDCPAHHCAVGSVKSNIGHALTAAGVAGLTKAMLCLKKRQLVPTLHVVRENQHIAFDKTPFYVNQKLQEWTSTTTTPLRAAVSSFGFSGSNAHIVLEEAPEEIQRQLDFKRGAYLFPVSGHTLASARQRVADLREFLLNKKNTPLALQDLSWTLAVGRNHFRYRVCLHASDVQELIFKLDEESLSFSDIKKSRRTSPISDREDMVSDRLHGLEWSGERSEPNDRGVKLLELSKSYLQGESIDWKQWFGEEKGRRLSLPTYPFDTQRYWVPGSPSKLDTKVEVLQPTHSVKKERRFELSGSENFFQDHVIGSNQILPGMAYIRLAMEEQSSGARLEDIEFLRPLISSGNPLILILESVPTLNQSTDGEILDFTDSEKRVLARMKKLPGAASFFQKHLDISDIQAKSESVMDREEVYAAFKNLGANYGATFQVIQKMWRGANGSLAKLVTQVDGQGSSLGHSVAILDGVCQAVLGLSGDLNAGSRFYPTHLKSFVTNALELPNECYAYAYAEQAGETNSETERSFNISVTNPSGEVLLELEGLTVKMIPGEIPKVEANSAQHDDDHGTDIANNGRASEETRRRLFAELAELVSETLKIPATEISAEDDLSEYGFDSISLTELSNAVLDRFQIQLSATIFFEHANLASIVGYLMESYPDLISKRYPQIQTQPSIKPSTEPEIIKPRQKAIPRDPISNLKDQDEPIAIVGVAGAFPQCDNISQFWKALEEGKDLISETPADRWDWKAFDGDPQKEPNKTRVHHGGFLNQVDRFDASFFGISPREAELMDPQHRLFLETVWLAIEDAGMRVSDLSGSRTGVYVGIASQDYKEILGESGITIDAYAATGMAHCLAANRVSYLLNLQGPSEAIDTACSSSLVAVHRAVEALRNGTCDSAIAGGVNLLLTPSLFISFDRAGMLSPDGRCKPFDSAANGYARGEGAGVVLLKRLSQAEADGDSIYAVIRGSGVNHGGRATSLTAPNPNAQAQLLVDTYTRAGVDPSTVSYMEAHGTGTVLGDPIEFNGLKRAFSQLSERFGVTVPEKHCAIGSVKSNLGHLETAAGITGLLKVALALKHRRLPGNLHFKEPNPHLTLEGSPFYILDKSQEWAPSLDGNVAIPRRAGVSSFGFGGANAHVILEEYTCESAHSSSETEPSRLTAIPISARAPQVLQVMAGELLERLDSNPDLRLIDVATTLQAGRDSWKHRVCFLSSTTEEFKSLLKKFIEGNEDPSILRSKQEQALMAEGLFEGDEAGVFLNALNQKGRILQLAKLWISGAKFDWPRLNGGKRISIPGYAFQRERHWYQSNKKTFSPSAAKLQLHPLVCENISTLSEQMYRSEFTGMETWFQDHQIQDLKLLPAAAQLEMTLFAASAATGSPVAALRNVLWKRPLIADGGLDTRISLFVEDSRTQIEIWSAGRAGTRIVYSQAEVDRQTDWMDSSLDIQDIKNRCSKILGSAECYREFEALGVKYGATFQVIHSLFIGEHEALAELRLSGAPGTGSSNAEIQIQPELLDGALQSVAGLMASQRESRAFAPHSLSRMTYCEAPIKNGAFYARAIEIPESTNDARVFNIQICDPEGKVLATLDRMEYRPIHTQPLQPVEGNVEADPSSLIFKPVWRPDNLKSDKLPQPIRALIFDFEKGVINKVENLAAPEVSLNWITFDVSNESSVDWDALYEQLVGDDDSLDTAIFNGLSPDSLYSFMWPVQWIHHCLKTNPKRNWKTLCLQQSVNGAAPQLDAWSSFAETIAKENSKCAFKAIETESLLTFEQFNAEAAQIVQGMERVRYQDGVRACRVLEEITLSVSDTATFRETGWYLITGGGGSIGKIMAKRLAEMTPANILLVGRSASPEWIKELPANVQYEICDISDGYAVEKFIQVYTQRHGRLNGILHSAGILKDGLFRNQTLEDFKETLRPKVDGAWNLDQAVGSHELDFFILFSSLASVVGNPGQASYSAANGFMDGLARGRQMQVDLGEKQGVSLSVNWPYWAEGGMRMAPAKVQFMESQLGMSPLDQNAGWQSLVRLISQCRGQVGLVTGDRDRLRKLLGTVAPTEFQQLRESSPSSNAQISSEDLRERLIQDVLEMVGQILKIDPQLIDFEEDLGDYGFDSISLTEFGNGLNETYSLNLSPSLFFEHRSLASFVSYLVSEFSSQLQTHYGHAPTPAIMTTPATADISLLEQPTPNVAPARTERRGRFSSSAGYRKENRDTGDIAVVGMSGVFPQSPDLESFWKNLMEGRNLVTPIPAERWDWKKYSPGSDVGDGTDVDLKYGGFMPDVDKFDAAFFGIAPHEARLMDPQHRIFLQLVWHALEDAGIAPASLAGTDAGLFVGVANFDYNGLIKSTQQEVEAHELTGTAHSILANRISYLLDIHGPSEPVDTACSSSLVAIHRAVQTLRAGESDLVIAGGINVLLSPDVYVAFSKAGMLSKNGKCQAFDASANGYVRGEGGGAVVLKPLHLALRDGNPIHAVIKATGVNHGGKAQSLTAPNPKGQSALLESVYDRSELPIETVSFIEAHGTGTPLGDPVEVHALQSAFRKLRRTSGDSSPLWKCGLGTVKTNIGHLETAAGIAGALKVILAMKHKKLPKTLHFSNLNPHIDFSNSPLYVVDHAQDWTRENSTTPLRAGVSSFGFGGVNAHVTLEEFPQNFEEAFESACAEQVIVLSARTESALRTAALQLAQRLQQQPNTSLENLTFTLQVGRDAMRYRAATLVSDIPDAISKLGQLAKGAQSEAWSLGESRKGRNLVNDENQSIRDLKQLADRWVQGQDCDWKSLHTDRKPRLISLPGYPFEKRRFWLENLDLVKSVTAINSAQELETIQETQNLHQPEPVLSKSRDNLRVEDFLTSKLISITGLSEDEIDPDAELSELGLDSILGMQLLSSIESEFQLKLYPNELMEHGSISKLALYLIQEMERGKEMEILPGIDSPGISNQLTSENKPLEIAAKSAVIRRAAGVRELVHPIVFVLSAPRSGSTLLRVMLDGNPQLYAPPELHLLPFHNMQDRAEKLQGRHAYLKEGLIKAVADLRSVTVDEAKACVDNWERSATPIIEVYRELQSWTGDRTLVDKSPSYGMDLEILKQIPGLGSNHYLIHLLRHPLSVTESLVRNRFDRLLGSDRDPWDFANEIWTQYNSNIRHYLHQHPKKLQLQLRYEELVTQPEKSMERICRFLEIPATEGMLQPCDRKANEGLHQVSAPIGDPNFNKRNKIEPGLADWTQRIEHAHRLSSKTLKLAEELNYSLQRFNKLSALAPSQLQALESGYAEQWLIVQETQLPILDPDPNRLQDALNNLIARHETLNWFFEKNEAGQWQAGVRPQDTTIAIVDLGGLNSLETKRKIKALKKELSANISITQGPLIQVALLKNKKDGSSSLLTIVSHLVSDGLSMNLFQSELWNLYRRPVKAGEKVELDKGYRNYISAIQERQLQFKNEEQFWKHQLIGTGAKVPSDVKRGADKFGTERTMEAIFQLDDIIGDGSKNLNEILPAFGIALGHMVAQWNEADQAVIALRMHQRSGAIGAFQKVFGSFAGDIPFPVPATIRNRDKAIANFKQSLKKIPHGGIGYSVLKQKEILENIEDLVGVRLNFQPIGPANANILNSTVQNAPEQRRPYALDFVVRMSQEECRVLLRYSSNRFRRTAIRGIMEELMNGVKELLNQKQGNNA